MNSLPGVAKCHTWPSPWEAQESRTLTYNNGGLSWHCPAMRESQALSRKEEAVITTVITVIDNE